MKHLFLVAMTAVCTGCGLLQAPSSPATARENVRAAVVVLAEGVRASDEICAARALDRHDLALAERCEDAYKTARLALLSAAEGVDAWGTAEQGDVACATARGAAAAKNLAKAIESGGASVPPILSDGLQLFAVLTNMQCEVSQ